MKVNLKPFLTLRVDQVFFSTKVFWLCFVVWLLFPLVHHFFLSTCCSSSAFFCTSLLFVFFQFFSISISTRKPRGERAPNGPQRPSKFSFQYSSAFFPVFSVAWLFYWMFLANGDHNDAISNRRREEKRRAKEWTKFEQKKKHTARSARQKNNGNKLNKLAKNHFLRDS